MVGWLQPDISSLTSFYERGKFKLAWRISVAFTAIFAVLTIMYGLNSSKATIPAAIVVLISGSSAIYLSLTKNYQPLFWIYAASGSLLAHFAMNYVLTYTHYVDFLWMAICIIMAFIGLGWLIGLAFILLHVAGIAYFFFFTLNEHILILQPKTNGELLADYLEVLFAFFVMAYLLRQYVIFQSHAETSLILANQDLARQNQLILAKNGENETLLKEIHHRVKNNLQIVVSLLRMQSAELKSEESQVHFTEAINRIMTMSLIHEKLYSAKELSKINLKSYLEQLVSEIVSVFPNNEGLDVQVEAHVERMNLESTVPLGLLVNELISNSLKHAFTQQVGGRIRIVITKEKGVLEFNYSDNGNWTVPDEEARSFGLELIDILTDQMNGKKELTTTNGTHYRFILNDTIPA